MPNPNCQAAVQASMNLVTWLGGLSIDPKLSIRNMLEPKANRTSTTTTVSTPPNHRE